MARPKNRADLRPELQGGLKRALMIMEQSGKPVSQIWIDLFDESPKDAMRLAISMLPKEVDMEVSQMPVDTTMLPDDILEQIHEYKRNEALAGTAGGDSSVH